MQLELTKEQEKEIAIYWIKQQQSVPDGYKQVIATLFVGAHFAKWSWMDAIRHAAKLCSKNYCVDMEYIKKDLV